jgi:Uma2 family endonuclease
VKRFLVSGEFLSGEFDMPIVVDGKTLLTYDDYVRIPEDLRRHEIIRGVHRVTPSPVTIHQRISVSLASQLVQQVVPAGHGVVLTAPMDVVLSETDVVQPDILVVLKDNSGVITEEHIRGAPDLTIEITSPSTRTRDLELKKELYESFGVSEYWVVRTHQQAVDRFILEGNTYGAAERFTEKLAFAARPGVAVDLNAVWTCCR